MVASKVATKAGRWNDALAEAGAPMVGFNAGWNEGVCAPWSWVVWGAQNGRALLRLVCDTAAVRGRR